MANIEFTFNAEKSAEAIIYLAQRLAEPTFMALAKLLYFADKTSLENYGYSITGDTYYAMRHGPVPSEAYNMMKAAIDTDVYGFHVEYKKYVRPDREPNLDKFSKADIKCLDQVLTAYGNFPVWHLRELSHDEAWQRAWERAEESRSVKIPMEDIIALVDDEDSALLEFLRETHKPKNR